MKLSVLIDNIANISELPVVDKLIEQKTDDVELLLLTVGKAKINEAVTVIPCKEMTHQEAICHGKKKTKGDYVAVVLADDMVADDYIEKILNATKDEPNTIFIKWKYENWHNMVFVGAETMFSDVVKGKPNNNSNIEIDDIIYYHKR